eukprot:s6013_g2.t1
MVEGLQDLMNFQLYGQDVTVNEASGKIAVHLVKYWTLLLEILAIAAWICFYNVKPTQDEGGLSSLIIVTVIALDVLHPCAYLWVGETKMTPAKANSLSWYQALTTWEWWERLIHDLILNELVTGVLKWLGPAWMIAMPLLTLLMPYIGVNQASCLPIACPAIGQRPADASVNMSLFTGLISDAQLEARQDVQVSDITVWLKLVNLCQVSPRF